VTRQGFHWLPIRNPHLLAVAELESYGDHRDPYRCAEDFVFDRLLVYQSRVEPMLLLSVDRQLERYGATVAVVA
jgi:PIN domain nuclease of toxin-antitoxin system